MIIIERTITIKNDQATLDSPIYLYRGDGDIVCLFTIKEMKKAATFGKIEANNPVSQASYGNVRIYKPDGSKCVFTEKSPIVDDKLQVTFSYENINDFTEVGVHKLQIHLYDDNDAHNESNDKNRFTLPPIDLHVLLPVGDDNNQVDEAIVDYSLLNMADESDDIFDEEGNYNKTVWKKGDIITQGKLNKIEEALYEINDGDYIDEETFNNALSNKAEESHTHTTANITGLSKVATSGSYKDLSNKPVIPDMDLYATKTELNAKSFIGHTHDDIYVRGDHDHDSDYAPKTHNHSEYATKSELSKVPTKVSDLFNDKEYITSTEIPSYYVTESELSQYGYITENYVNGNFASQAYVIAKIAEAQLGGGGGGDGSIDVSGFALKSDIPTNTSQLYNNSGFITEKALEGYATTTYVSDTIDNRLENVNIDLSNYPTNDDMNNALSNKSDADHKHDDKYATTDHRHDDIYALKTDIPNIVEVPTKLSELENDKGYITEEAISDCAKKSDIPTNVSAFTNDKDYIISSGIEKITRIEIVSELPEDEEDGVLYIVKE